MAKKSRDGQYVVDENSQSIDKKLVRKDLETQGSPKKSRFKTEVNSKGVSHVAEEEPGMEESQVEGN